MEHKHHTCKCHSTGLKPDGVGGIGGVSGVADFSRWLAAN